MSDVNKSLIQRKNKTRQIISCLALSLILFGIPALYSASNFDEIIMLNDESQVMTSNGSGQTDPAPFIDMENVSQFDIHETAVFQNVKNDIDILNENLTYDIPTNWEAIYFESEFESAFYEENVLEYENLDFSTPELGYQWYPYNEPLYDWSPGKPDSYPYINYSWNTYDGGNGKMDMIYNCPWSYPYELHPNDDYFGLMMNRNMTYGHGDDEVEVGELFETERSEFPIDNYFETDPEYLMYEDPYGEGRNSSIVDMWWEPTHEAIITHIDSDNSEYRRGDPSVAALTQFFIPFEADSVTITIGWAVDNLGYGKDDGFQVKARIDNQYIDGRWGAYGESYIGTASEDSLEFDDTLLKKIDHDTWYRTYNITELCGNYGERTGWHQLDFGAWMEEPQSGSADVNVAFDYIQINATHEDWYSAAEVEFEYILEIEQGVINDDMGLYLVAGDANSGDLGAFLINTTDNLALGDWSNRKTLSVNIPQKMKSVFEVDGLQFGLGLYVIDPWRIGQPPPGPSDSFRYNLQIDNMNITVNYIVDDDPGIEYRIVENGMPWTPITPEYESWIDPPVTSPEMNIEFRATVPEYIGREIHLRFFSVIALEKQQKGIAEASVSVVNYWDSYSTWNVTYNNTDSANEIDDSTLPNNLLLLYNTTIVNLPAHDGLGGLSQDWNVDTLYGNGVPIAEDIGGLSSTNPFYQNATIVQNTAFGEIPIFSGEYSLICYQNNYLTNGTITLATGEREWNYYHGDAALFNLNVTNSSALSTSDGHYRIEVLNESWDIHPDFPMYFDGINTTVPWSVNDEGVGSHDIFTYWNDTTIDDQTYRIGWFYDIFWISRATSVRIISYPNKVAPGAIAKYVVEFNKTLDESTGVENAEIQAINNKTFQLWGENWPPYTYMLDYKIYLGDGQYEIGLKTQGAPLDNYTIFFDCHKPYYDYKQSDTVPLNITTEDVLKNMTISYLDGGYNYTDANAYLTQENYPYINDTTSSIVQFKLNETGGDIIRDAYITANFAGTENIMVAIEQYAFTHLPADKGVYNLTLDTTGLNATDGVTVNNYTLEISFSVDQFNPKFQNISIPVLPLNLSIDPQAVSDMYEGESFSIDAALYIQRLTGLEAWNDATLYYNIYNSSGLLLNGQMNQKVSNSFTADIVINSSNYLVPGDYWIFINASGDNLVDEISTGINFTVFEKDSTATSLVFPQEVRIGEYFSISAKLEFINRTAIQGEELFLTINYSRDYSYQIFGETDSAGNVVHELLIPSYYYDEDNPNNLTVYAEFKGTEILKSSWANKTDVILGKIPVNITFDDPPSFVQVGYNATFAMNLSIYDKDSYEGTLVYFYGFYDGQTQPFIIRELSTNAEGTASYTLDEIQDGKSELTVVFEFPGDAQTEYKTNQTTCKIVDKWNSTIDFELDNVLNPLDNEARIGQSLSFNFTVNPLESNFSETFTGAPLSIQYNYTTVSESYITSTSSLYTNENSSVLYDYVISNGDYTHLQIKIKYNGNKKIEQSEVIIDIDLLPKLDVSLDFTSSSSGELIQGVYYYSINLSDSQGNPLPNIDVNFIVLDDSDTQVGDAYSGVTNNEGLVSVSIDFNDLDPGTYKVKAQFSGGGIYASGESSPVSVQVTTPFLIFLDYLPYILLAVGILVASILIVYRAVIIPRRIRRMEALKTIHQRFEDAENIQYILILSRESGLNIFARSFTNLPIDADLISGFLTAISSFGAEIGGKMEKKASSEKGLEQLSYKQFKIIVNDVALVRTAILLLKDASPSLKDKLRRFNLRFQEQHMDVLENWNGAPLAEGPVMELIEEHLEVDLLYPHNLNPSAVDRIIKEKDKKSIARAIIEEAQKPRFNSSFLIRDMINAMIVQGKEEVMIFNGINTLRTEKAVFAVNPRTKYLIDQFKPIIDRISEDSRKILMSIADGITAESRLRKIKGIEKFDESLMILIEMGLIDRSMKLTDIGEAVATLIKIIPNI